MKHERQWWAEHLARLASSHGQAAQRAYRAGWLATARVEARSAWHYANRADLAERWPVDAWEAAS